MLGQSWLYPSESVGCVGTDVS